MSKKTRRRRRSEGRSIDELAHLFLVNKYTFVGIINKFGEPAARTAVDNMAKTLLLCDPDNVKAKRWLNPSRQSDNKQNIGGTHITDALAYASQARIRGKSLNMIILDDDLIRENPPHKPAKEYLRYDKTKGRQSSPIRSRH